MLEKLAAEQGKKIQAIEIQMPQELLAKRMVGRRNCPVCGEIYNVYFKPPKNDNRLRPASGDAAEPSRGRQSGNSTGAAGDLREANSARCSITTKPPNLLHVVDGTREPEEIYKDIEEIVTSDELSR